MDHLPQGSNFCNSQGFVLFAIFVTNDGPSGAASKLTSTRYIVVAFKQSEVLFSAVIRDSYVFACWGSRVQEILLKIGSFPFL